MDLSRDEETPMINYFDGRFHQFQIRLLGKNHRELRGKGYKRQSVLMKFEIIQTGPNSAELRATPKTEIQFNGFLRPTVVHAFEIMIKNKIPIYHREFGEVYRQENAFSFNCYETGKPIRGRKR